MPQTLLHALLLTTSLLSFASMGRAGVDVAITNGDKVTGSLSPATEVEILRVTLPNDALLSVVATGRRPKGKKQSGSSAPRVSFRVLNENGIDIAAEFIRAKGKSGSTAKNVLVPATGTYRIEVTGDGENVGDYQLKVKWKSQTKLSRDVQLSDGEVAIDFAVDPGARATVVAKPARGSDALPRLVRIERLRDADRIDIDQPATQDKQHKAKKIALARGGDYRLFVAGVGGVGAARVTVKIKAPKTSKRNITVRGIDVGAGGGDDFVIGVVIPAAGGEFAVPPENNFGLGEASLLVPPGALTLPTSLLIGSAPPIRGGLADDVRAAGPTVFFGPVGQVFDEPVTVSIPFDAVAFGDDFSSLIVVERDGRGRTRIVPRPYSVDVSAGTVSFPVSHFTAFRAFGRLPTVRSDLNNDGLADLVVTDSSGGVNRVRVVLGGPGLTTRGIDARDVVFQGTASNSRLGNARVVADVSGDGIDDLILSIADPVAGGMGRILIFLGGAEFRGSLDVERDADFVLRGGGRSARALVTITVGQFVGDATLDIATAIESPSVFGMHETVVYEGGAALTSDAVPAVTFTGPQSNGIFSLNVAAADVSGDGIDDLIIGSAFSNLQPRGVVYVFFGGAGFVSGPLTDADVALTATADSDLLGNFLAVGDVIGDGAADIVVHAQSVGAKVQSVFIFAGGAGLADGDSSTADVKLTDDSVAASGRFGTVLAIADVSGSAKGDLLIGDSLAAVQAENRGLTAVFEGGPSLTSGGPSDADFTIEGLVDLSRFGDRLSAQDLDGDGLAEVIVVDFAPVAGGLRGSLYIFSGTRPLPQTADLADIILTGLNFGD